MKKVKSGSFKLLLLGVVLVSTGTVGFGQFAEDALRFSTPGLGVGARALGMGGAYTGVASDYSALYWNPAGLAQLEHGEFSFGLSHLNFKDQSSYFNLSKSQSSNSTTLNSLGLVFPVPVARGSLVFAFGYNRGSNYTAGLGIERLNAESIIQDWGMPRNPVLAVNGDTVSASEFGDNLAYRLYLADTLRRGQAIVWNSPIRDRLTQIEKLVEGGGVNNWTVGGAVDVAKNIAVGLNISYKSGSYKFERTYTERDINNVYSSSVETSPRNFNSLAIEEYLESELTGFDAKLGLMIRQPDRYRIGLSVKTPTSFRIKETFAQGGNARFVNTPDFGTTTTLDAIDETGEYDLPTPWVLSAGGSLILNELVLSGDVEYTDWTQMEFKNANREVLALNKTFKDLFRASMNVRAGAEYNFAQAGLRARGGFIYNTSQYEGDPSSFDQKFVTAGLGFFSANPRCLISPMLVAGGRRSVPIIADWRVSTRMSRRTMCTQHSRIGSNPAG